MIGRDYLRMDSIMMIRVPSLHIPANANSLPALSMKRVVVFLLPCMLVLACKTPKLAERVPGRWGIEHYEEYAAATETGSGHSLDECGYLEFRKGRVARKLYPGKAHGSLQPIGDARYSFEDSLFVIRDAGGAPLERWLLTKDLIDYMEWVRVSENRDTVFTMYLRK